MVKYKSCLKGIDCFLISPEEQPSTQVTPVNQIQGSSIPDRVESHGYSPFKVGHHLISTWNRGSVRFPQVDFKQNKVEWALARVDDLVNWGRSCNI